MHQTAVSLTKSAVEPVVAPAAKPWVVSHKPLAKPPTNGAEGCDSTDLTGDTEGSQFSNPDGY